MDYDALLKVASKIRAQEAAREKGRVEALARNTRLAAEHDISEQIAIVCDLVKRCDCINSGETEYSEEACRSWISNCNKAGQVIHKKGGCDLMRWVIEKFVPRAMHCNFDQGFNGIGTEGGKWVH